MRSILSRHAGFGVLLLRSGNSQPIRSPVHGKAPIKHLQKPAETRRARVHLAAGSAVADVPAAHDGLNLYEQPALYDAVFSQRHFAEQVDFLVDVAERQTGRQPESFLELGCGPARHSRLLAARGLRGFAVDNCPAMLQYAQECALADGSAVDFISGDMRQPCLPAGAAVDLVMLLCGTVSHLLGNDDALAAFGSAAASLADRGVCVVEMAHPVDLFSGMLEVGDTWEVEGTEFGQLHVNYGAEDGCDEMQPLSQTLDRSVKVAGTKGEKRLVLAEGVVRQRLFTAQEIDLLGRAAGLKVVAQYGALKLPFVDATDEEEGFSLVTVLQK